VVVVATPAPNQFDGFGGDRPQNPRDHGGAVQLGGSCRVRTALVGELPFGQDFPGGYLHVVKPGRAATGEPLADAVPVVGNVDTVAVRRHHHRDRLSVLIDRLDEQHVAVDVAGAVELLAVEDVAIVAGRQCGVEVRDARPL
jgi:hypothetical protein